MKLFDVYDAGCVLRYHAKRTHGSQTVADHTWGVCLVLLWLYEPALPSVKILRSALLHDVHEVITGDVPAPAKWRSPALTAALTELEASIATEMELPEIEMSDVLRFADTAELTMYSIVQANMGNWYFIKTARRGFNALMDINLPEFFKAKEIELKETLKEDVHQLEMERSR